MSQDLIAGLVPMLAALGKGGYARTYGRRGKQLRSSTHEIVAELLDALGIPYEQDVAAADSGRLKADFFVNGTMVFVDRELSPKDVKQLADLRTKVLQIDRYAERSDRLDNGIRVLGLGEDGRTQTIFLDDPSFNFDYAHILPKTEKCSVMHGHTSSVLVEVIGHPIDGMVVDFGSAKQIVREAVLDLDHKLFINRKYVKRLTGSQVSLEFETVHGPFAITAPRPTTVLLEGEATVENLARVVLSKVAQRMPENVTAVGVYVYEGLNKGSHVLAKVHEDQVIKPRKKR